MSTFWKDFIITFLLILINFILFFGHSIGILSLTISGYDLIVFKIISIALLFFKMITIQGNIGEYIHFKYKIIVKTSVLGTDTYYAKVLRPWFWFIIFWRPVEMKSEMFEYDNMFGGKSFGFSTDEKEYKTEIDAITAIRKHKIDCKEEIDEYFAKQHKEVNRIIKVK